MLLTIVAFLLVQDDLSPWVDRLGSESLEEREAATEHLVSLGLPAIERLEKARDVATDPEVRDRLVFILSSIRKRAEFAKVFGETKRVTIHAKERKLGDMLKELSRQLDEPIESERLDLNRTVDLQLKEVTMWQAFDAVAEAVGGRYEYEDEKTVFRPGPNPQFPVVYANQFRVSIAEVKRIHFRSSGISESIVLAVVEVRYQRNMHPTEKVFPEFVFDSVVDSKGNAVRVDQPDWIRSSSWPGGNCALLDEVYVHADAASPLTVQGSAEFLFDSQIKEIALALEGDSREQQVGNQVIRVAGFPQSRGTAHLKLEAHGPHEPETHSRLKEVWILDGGNQKHEAKYTWGWNEGGECNWDFELSGEIRAPQKVILNWISEFHRVNLPFRLEGIQIPE